MKTLFVLTVIYKAENPFCNQGIRDAVYSAGGEVVETPHQITLSSAYREVGELQHSTQFSDLDDQARTEFQLLASSRGMSLDAFLSHFESIEQAIESLSDSNLRTTAVDALRRFQVRRDR